MRKLTVLCLSALIFSCVKEKNTFSNTFFENNTGHSIKVSAFSNGVISSSMSFELEPNERRMIFYNNTRGFDQGVSYGRISQFMDSIVVKFDNSFSMVHYKSNLVGVNPKRYLYDSKRNLLNDSSYQFTLVKQTKGQRDVEFLYSFTEQDYLDAK